MKHIGQNPEAFDKLIKKGNKPISSVEKQLKLQEKRKRLRETARNSETKIPDGCKLILGDFIERSNEIPDNSVDLIFTY